MMNQVLMQAIIDMVLFLGLSEDYEVNPESAKICIEDLSARLQDLSHEERITFVKYIADLATKWQDTGATEQGIAFLQTLPSRLALVPSKNQRYFVLRFGGPLPPKLPTQEFQIQVLDSLGRARISEYISSSDTHLVIKGHTVPDAVLAVAHRLQPGEGRYVDETGETLDPLVRTRELLKSQKPYLP